MSDLINQVKELYAAFARGDAQFILAAMADDVSWEFEAPAEITWSGIRRGPSEAAGFFTGIAAEHADPALSMTEVFSSDDAVAAFGRYQATVRASGIRVDTPVAHYFQFHNGKVRRYVNIVNSGAFLKAAQASARGTSPA